MQLPPGTHFLYCLHLFASSIIESSWSRYNSNWIVDTVPLHRCLINTEIVFQCVWRMKLLQTPTATATPHGPNTCSERHWVSQVFFLVQLTQPAPNTYFHISNEPSWELCDLTWPMLATAASAKKATRYPSRHTHQHIQRRRKRQRRGQKCSPFNILAFLTPGSSQEALKPQEMLLKSERELWQLVALFRAQTTSLIWKVMSQEAKLTFQGVFSHVGAYLKGKNLTTD